MKKSKKNNKNNNNGNIVSPVLTWNYTERTLMLIVGKFKWNANVFPNPIHISQYDKHALDMPIHELMDAAGYPTEKEKDEALGKLMNLYETGSEVAIEILAGLADKALVNRLTAKPKDSIIRKALNALENPASEILSVANKKDLLSEFADYAQKRMWEDGDLDLSEFVDEFLNQNES